MMARTISVGEVDGRLGEVIGRVAMTKQPVIVEDAGEPVAVVISPEDYRRFQEEEDRLWAAVQRVQERNADRDPDEAYRLVMEIVADVRRERHEGQQAAG